MPFNDVKILFNVLSKKAENTLIYLSLSFDIIEKFLDSSII